jgi:hypothetical protein
MTKGDKTMSQCVEIPDAQVPEEVYEVIELIKQNIKTRRDMGLLRCWMQMCEHEWKPEDRR